MFLGCLLYKLCALLMIHFEAVARCQMRNEHDVTNSAASHPGNAFYALRSCHQILHGDRGEFFSPDYLCSNPALWCNWTVQVQPGKRVQIYLEDLTPEHACHLKTDQIHLDESGGDNRILERCWRRRVYTSYSNTVHVVQLIRSNPDPLHRGFYGVYQAFGLPETSDLNKDLSEEVVAQIGETEDEDAVTKISGQESSSNDLEENLDAAHVEQMEGSKSLWSHPESNEVLLEVNAGPFKESRKIRGEAKNPEVPLDAALPSDDVEVLFSAPTEKPNWVTVWKHTSPMTDDETRGPDTLALAPTTHSIATSTGTTPTRPTKKKAVKRKPVLAQSSTTTANVGKDAVTHLGRVVTRSPGHPTQAATAEPQTLSVKDVAPVSMETDGVSVVQLDSEEFTENRSNSKKIKQPPKVKEKSLPVQNFILATEPPPSPGDCSGTSVPTLLYVVCFLLCFLIVLLMLALAVIYRRSRRGTFLPRCHCSGSSFTDDDINNNNDENGEDRNTSRLPPPPPPLRLAGGAHDLPLLRFGPLTPPDAKPQQDNDVL